MDENSSTIVTIIIIWIIIMFILGIYFDDIKSYIPNIWDL